jgi:O-antigen ligase
MKAVEGSAMYRAAASAFRWAERCSADSLIGRGVARAGKALGPVFADSLTFGTGRVTSPALPHDPMSLTAAAFARPALALRGAIDRGAPGRFIGGLTAAAPSSAFAGGNWLRVLGAALLGLGCGMLSSKASVAVLGIILGLVFVVVGPWLLTALAASGVARLFGWRGGGRGTGRGAQPAPGSQVFTVPRATWVAMVLALAAGALAGAGPNTKSVVAAAVFIAVVAAVLWRPQLVLLVVAAFPWVDWVARTMFPAIGPLWDDALLVASAVLIVWSVLVLKRDLPRSVPATLPVLVMLAAAAASIVVNRVPTSVGFYAVRVLFEPILFYFVGFLIPKDRRWVRWAVGVFILTGTLLALHGLYQYLTHAPMPAHWVDVTETSITTRAYSVVQNPNVLGGILAMSALISGSLALSRAFSGARRIGVLAACIIQLGGLAVTFSRGAWIGLGVGLVAMLVLAYGRYIVAAVVVAIVAWFAAPAVFVQRLLFSFSSAYTTKSATGLGRVWRWEASLQHIADKPLLGLGLGMFGGTTAYMFGYWAIWVDNFYLQMAAEGGLILLAVFLWLLIRSGKGLVGGYRGTSDPYLKALAAGMFGAFLAVIVADFFEADWETLSVGVEFWFLAGLVTSALLQGRRPAGQEAEAQAGASARPKIETPTEAAKPTVAMKPSGASE